VVLVLLDQQVLQDHEVQLVQQVIKVLTEPVVLLDQLARQVLQVLVLQVLLAFKVYKVI
jgi:transcriptional regulator CtsR